VGWLGCCGELSAELNRGKDRRSLSAHSIEGRRIDAQGSEDGWGDLDGAD
jgi:hypothetical protein